MVSMPVYARWPSERPFRSRSGRPTSASRGRWKLPSYFIVAEALAKVAKHSRASKAWVRIEQRNGAVRVEVGDDGAGGAALDGRLSVDSPVGGGTRVLVEIPCAS
jgi:signal transduction histidine kinase